VQDNSHESKHNRGGRSTGQHQKKRITNIPPEDSHIFDAAAGLIWVTGSKFRGGGGGSVLGGGAANLGVVVAAQF
jgi:hypothetical protein